MVSSLFEKNVTADEIGHVTAGYTYWCYHDYRLDPENGNLPQRIFALPLLSGGFKPPSRNTAAWWKSDEWRVGYQWFYQSGNNADAMLRRGRAVAGLMAVALGALVWWWSRKLFGPWGGLLFSLLLYVLNPTVLANGALMTSDTTAALFFLASLLGLWAVLHKITPGRVLASALAVGGLFV